MGTLLKLTENSFKVKKTIWKKRVPIISKRKKKAKLFSLLIFDESMVKILDCMGHVDGYANCSIDGIH